MKNIFKIICCLLVCLLLSGCDFKLNDLYKSNSYTSLMSNHKSYKVIYKYNDGNESYMYFDGAGYYNFENDVLTYYKDGAGYTLNKGKVITFCDFDYDINEVKGYGSIYESYGLDVKTSITNILENDNGYEYTLSSKGDLSNIFPNVSGDELVEVLDLNSNKELLKDTIKVGNEDYLVITVEYDVDSIDTELKDESLKEKTITGKFIFNNKEYIIKLNSDSNLGFLSGYKYYSDIDCTLEIESSVDVSLSSDFVIYVKE